MLSNCFLLYDSCKLDFYLRPRRLLIFWRRGGRVTPKWPLDLIFSILTNCYLPHTYPSKTSFSLVNLNSNLTKHYFFAPTSYFYSLSSCVHWIRQQSDQPSHTCFRTNLDVPSLCIVDYRQTVTQRTLIQLLLSPRPLKWALTTPSWN